MATVGLIAGAGLGVGTGLTFGATSFAALATAASIGMSVGGAIGGMYEAPEVGKIKKLDDFGLQTASEGSPINYCLGPTIRVPGTVIWSSEVNARPQKEQLSKKGSKTKVGYKYNVDLAVGVCEGEISDIIKIFADGNLIYDSATNIDESSDQFILTAHKLYYVPEHDESATYEVERYLLRIESPSGSYDLTNVKPGEFVTISGCTNSINNGVFRCLKSYTSGTSTFIELFFYTWQVDVDVNLANAGDVYTIEYDGSTVATYTAQIGDSEADISSGLGTSWEANKGSDAEDISVVSTINDTVVLETEERDIADLITVKVNGGASGNLTVTENGMVTPVAESGATVRIQQTLPEFSYEHVEDITIYTGSDSQSVDSIIEGHEGAGEVPAFRGISYVVFDDLELEDFGNRIPQFQFIVESNATLTVREAIGYLVERSGELASGDYDVSGVDAGKSLRGMYVPGPSNLVSALKDIMLTFNIDVKESYGKLYFYDRDNLTEVTIDEDDLAAQSSDEETTLRPFEIRDLSGLELPKQLDIGFMEPALDYQRGSQTVRKINGVGSSHNTMSYELPITLTASEAITIAKRELWIPWMLRQQFMLRLPPNYIHLEVGDVLTVTVDSIDYKFFVTKIDRGYNFIHEISGYLYQDHIFDQSALADSADYNIEELPVPPALYASILDISALREEDIEKPGVYIAGFLTDKETAFSGGFAYLRDKKTCVFNTRYGKGIKIEEEATAGETSDSTTEHDAQGTDIWDLETELYVEMLDGTLESLSKDDVEDGGNRAIWGGEVIAFQNATLVSGTTYKLTYLLRGLRNTEYFINQHNVSSGEREIFVLLNDFSPIEFMPLKMRRFEQNTYFKGIANGQDPDDLKPKRVKFMANNVRPWAPCHVKGSRNGSNDLTISWVRRSRGFYEHFQGNTCPLEDSPERYEIEILDGVGGNVVRTFHIDIKVGGTSTVVDYTSGEDNEESWYEPETTEVVYPATGGGDQTSDGFTPGDLIYVRVYQIGKKAGRGRYKEEEV